MPKLAANLTMLFGEVRLSRPLRGGSARGIPRRRVPVSLRLRRAGPEAAAARPRARAGAAQPAGRQLGRRRTRHRVPSGSGRRVQGGRRPGDRIRDARWTATASTASPASRRGVDPAAARDDVRRRICATRRRGSQAAGIKLLIEPINTRDMPGFFLSGTQQAIEIIDAVGSDNLFAAVRHLPHADHGGGPRRDDRAPPAAHRAHAARRRPGPPRAGHRRHRLRFAARA